MLSKTGSNSFCSSVKPLRVVMKVGLAPSKVGGPDSLSIGTPENTFSRMPGARPVWKCRTVAAGKHNRNKAQYLFKLQDKWVVAVGPSKFANYKQFRQVQQTGMLKVTWTSSTDIMKDNLEHEWTPFHVQLQASAVLACHTIHLPTTASQIGITVAGNSTKAQYVFNICPPLVANSNIIRISSRWRQRRCYVGESLSSVAPFRR